MCPGSMRSAWGGQGEKRWFLLFFSEYNSFIWALKGPPIEQNRFLNLTFRKIKIVENKCFFFLNKYFFIRARHIFVGPLSGQLNMLYSPETKKKSMHFSLTPNALLLDHQRTSPWPPTHFSLTPDIHLLDCCKFKEGKKTCF